MAGVKSSRSLPSQRGSFAAQVANRKILIASGFVFGGFSPTVRIADFEQRIFGLHLRIIWRAIVMSAPRVARQRNGVRHHDGAREHDRFHVTLPVASGPRETCRRPRPGCQPCADSRSAALRPQPSARAASFARQCGPHAPRTTPPRPSAPRAPAQAHTRPVWHGNDEGRMCHAQPARSRTRAPTAPRSPRAPSARPGPRRAHSARESLGESGRMEARMDAGRGARIFSPSTSASNREARFRRRRAWMENRMAEIFVRRENIGIPGGCGRELPFLQDEYRAARRRLSAAAA